MGKYRICFEILPVATTSATATIRKQESVFGTDGD